VCADRSTWTALRYHLRGCAIARPRRLEQLQLVEVLGEPMQLRRARLADHVGQRLLMPGFGHLTTCPIE
jgi:hypothetical protein